jgi:hypothetical protein
MSVKAKEARIEIFPLSAQDSYRLLVCFAGSLLLEDCPRKRCTTTVIVPSRVRFNQSSQSRSSWLIAIRSILQPCGCQQERCH